MSFERQMRRKAVKRIKRNNRIAKAWESLQIKRYGFKKWWDMRVDCDPKRRRASTLIKAA